MLDDSSHILLGNNPVFAHDKNNLTFDFASSALTSSELNKFSWKLVGYDDEWSAPVTGRNSVSYQNLNPGAYTFLVKSCNVTGLWDISGTSFNFYILPAWYETWIFRVLAFLSVLAILWYLFTLQINKQVALQKLENERAMAVSNERNRIARDMHDDLGSGLSAIHLYSEYLKNMTESDFPQLSTQLNYIVNSSGELNQKLKEIIWSNESDEISLITLTRFVKSFVQSGAGDIKFSIIGPEAKADIILDQKVHKNLFLSIKELINNALKYSGASEIKVEINCIARSQSIMILIVDNGKGFDFNTAILKGGNGLKNIISRMNEIGGTMQVDSGSFGTQTKLLLP
jgi:signal transduction histidine kinase